MGVYSAMTVRRKSGLMLLVRRGGLSVLLLLLSYLSLRSVLASEGSMLSYFEEGGGPCADENGLAARSCQLENEGRAAVPSSPKPRTLWNESVLA